MMNHPLRIREIAKKDNSALEDMIREVFDEYDAPKIGTVYSDPSTSDLYQLFRTNKSALWVAEMNHQALGCCGIFPTDGLPIDTVELVKFYLPASARGKGIGKQLMEHSISSAIELGYKKIYLESLPLFSEALGIYQKYGFRILSEPLGNSGHGSCSIWMLKDLI
jgi:putative acetyltransferase